MFTFFACACCCAMLLMFISEIILYRNEARLSDRNVVLKNQLAYERLKVKGLEQNVYSLEHQRDMANHELNNQAQLCDIYEELSEIYKSRVKTLEKIIEETDDTIDSDPFM